MKAARPAKGSPRMAPLLIFDELTRGESYLYVRQCTAVNAGALLLVASDLDHSRALRLAIASQNPQVSSYLRLDVARGTSCCVFMSCCGFLLVVRLSC